MKVNSGYIHFYYNNFLKENSAKVLYQTKNQLLEKQKGLLLQRKIQITQGEKEAEDILDYMLKHKSILEKAYAMTDSIQERDVKINFEGYSTMQSLATAIMQDANAINVLIDNLDIFQNKLEDILKFISGFATHQTAYDAIAASIIRQAQNTENVKTKPGGVAEQILRTLLVKGKTDKTGDASIIKVSPGSQSKLNSGLKRAIAMVQALKMPGAKEALININAEDPELIRRILVKLGGLLPEVKGQAGESISHYGLGLALNMGNNALIKMGATFNAKGIGKISGSTIDLIASPAFVRDAQLLKKATDNFQGLGKRAGKGDIYLTVTTNKVSLGFSISEKEGTIKPNNKISSIKLVDKTPFFSAIGRSGLYEKAGFITAFRNAAGGHGNDAQADLDFSAAVESVKYGSFLQHLAGIARKEDNSDNIMFIVINRRKIISIEKLLQNIIDDKVDISLTPMLSRKNYIVLNDWIPGDNKEMKEIRSEIAKVNITKQWYDDKVRMNLLFR